MVTNCHKNLGVVHPAKIGVQNVDLHYSIDSIDTSERTFTKLNAWRVSGGSRTLRRDFWGISPKNLGPKNYCFWQLCNSVAMLRAIIFGEEHDMDNRETVLETKGVPYVIPKYQMAKNRTWIFTYYPKNAFFFHWRASHMHFRPQNSTKLCHTVGCKPR